MNRETKIFELGERRRITLSVWLNTGQDFVFNGTPTWALSFPPVEDSGTCEVVQDGKRWNLTAEIQPQKRGNYELQYTFGIGTEIHKKSCKIRVE